MRFSSYVLDDLELAMCSSEFLYALFILKDCTHTTKKRKLYSVRYNDMSSTEEVWACRSCLKDSQCAEKGFLL